MLNRPARVALRIALVAFASASLSSPLPAAEGGQEESGIVYRSMAESPLIAAPGKMVDFLDERWVEDTHCLTRKLTQAELLQEPAVRHDNVNAPMNASGSVLQKDGGGFAFYYQTVPRFLPWHMPEDAPDSVRQKWKKYRGTMYRYFVHYATSDDGIDWDLPNLGLRKSYPVTKETGVVHVEGKDAMQMKWLEDKNNNILLGLDEKDANGRRLTGASGAGGGFCVIDAQRTPHPAARGRYTALYQSDGLCLAYSDDGFDWLAYPENPIRVGQSSDTYNTLMYDPRRKEYAIYCRPRWSRGGPDPRAVARIPSKDLIHWGPERIILQTDDLDAPAHGRRELPADAGESVFTRGRELQFYSFTPAIYQDVYIGFALVHDTHTRKSWQELVHSYDGIDWIREPRREPFIAPEPDTWNAGGVYFMATGCPVEIDDHYFFYATATNALHGWELTSMKDQGKIRWILGARIRKGRFVGYATGVHYPFDRTATKREIPPYWQDRGMLMTSRSSSTLNASSSMPRSSKAAASRSRSATAWTFRPPLRRFPL